MNILDTIKSCAAVIAAVVALWFAGAQAEESRCAWVIGFDFASGEVLLEDNCGFVWSCPFGKHDWCIGDMYSLFIDGEQIEIEEALINENDG